MAVILFFARFTTELKPHRNSRIQTIEDRIRGFLPISIDFLFYGRSHYSLLLVSHYGLLPPKSINAYIYCPAEFPLNRMFMPASPTPLAN